MTGISEVWDAGRVEADLADTMKALGLFREVLWDMVERLKGEGEVTGADAAKPLGDLGRALMSAVKLEREARHERAKEAGGVGHGALDLAAARDEVECRLACLRATLEGDGSAGGAE